MTERVIRTLTPLAFLTALLVFGADSSSAADIPSLRYKIDRIAGESVQYRITLSFKGESDGVTNIELPNEWGGQLELYKAIKDLRAVSRQAAITNTDEPHVKAVTHQPDAEVAIVAYGTAARVAHSAVLKARAEGIRAGRFGATPSAMGCGYCPFREICPDAAR